MFKVQYFSLLTELAQKTSFSLSPGLANLSTSLVHAAGEHSGGHVGEPGKASDVSRTIVVTMLDNYYEPENFSISLGETIRFIVKNEGELVHEFNIATKKMHLKHQPEMSKLVENEILLGDKIDKKKMKEMAKKLYLQRNRMELDRRGRRNRF